MEYLIGLSRLVSSVVIVLALASCTTSKPMSANETDVAKGARSIVGSSLPGAIGQTAADQEKIDDTITGGCATGVWTAAECRKHTQEVRARAPIPSS